MSEPARNEEGEVIFPDHPEFTPNLTPKEIFEMGSFGGTYWRPICSEVTGKCYTDVHKKYPASWWENVPEDHLTRAWEDYDTSINKYGVKVGTTLEEWEEKGWITKYNPYGWVHWLSKKPLYYLKIYLRTIYFEINIFNGATLHLRRRQIRAGIQLQEVVKLIRSLK